MTSTGPRAIEQVLADHAPRALDQGRLLSGHELLLPITRELSLAPDLPALARIVQTAARGLTGADNATFAVREDDECHYLDETRDRPAPAAAPDETAPAELVWKGRRLPLGDCLSGWAMLHRRTAVVDDVSADPRVSSAVREAPVRSAVAVPVCSAQPVAAIGAYWSQQHDPDATEVWLLQALADSAAVALEGLELRRQAEQTIAAKTADMAAFTYAISHDLRAPVRHLEGFARILLQDTAELEPQTRHGAQRIYDAAVHLREMVNGILTLSRITQSEVHAQPLDLAELARNVARSLADAPTPETGPQRAGAVDFTAPQSMPATGDPRLLQTVLKDLLDNAWKFTSRIPHPRVELGIVPAEPSAADPGAAETVYFVRDNGAGFEPAAAQRLFGVFQRLHSGEDFPGTGIGLASVKRIMDKHGGSVSATGSPDQGATFFFSLPNAREPRD